jgi:hypothetical protein
MPERRRHERYSCAELVNVSSETRRNRVGLARNLSASGMRFQSISRFEVGERLELLVHISSIGTWPATGRVVRKLDRDRSEHVHPFGFAVEFETERSDLVESLSANRLALEVGKLI